MAKTRGTALAPQPPPDRRGFSALEFVFLLAAVLVGALTVWYGLARKEFILLPMGLAVTVLLAFVSLRPWRRAKDPRALALWATGLGLLVLGYMAQETPTAYMGGVGAGIVLGLALSLHLYPKPTP